MNICARILCIVSFIAASLVQAASVADIVGTNDCYQLSASGKIISVLDCKSGQLRTLCTAPAAVSWDGGFNVDATKIIFNTSDSKTYVVDWNGSNLQQVASGVNSWPHKTDWVVYCSGGTWKVQFDKVTNRPIESTRKKLSDRAWKAGLNGSGEYLGDSYKKAAMMQVSTGKISGDFNNEQNCSASMYPGDKARMMFSPRVLHNEFVIYEWNPTTNAKTKLWAFSGTEIFGLWSSNNPDFCVFENPFRICKISSKQTASIKISVYIGGPWVGKRAANPTQAKSNLLDPDKADISYRLNSISNSNTQSIFDLRGNLLLTSSQANRPLQSTGFTVLRYAGNAGNQLRPAITIGR